MKKSSFIFGLALTAAVAAGVGFAIPVPHLNSGSKQQMTTVSEHRAIAPQLVITSMPRSHIVAGLMFEKGHTPLYTDTSGRIIGRASSLDSSHILWSDGSQNAAKRVAKIVW